MCRRLSRTFVCMWFFPGPTLGRPSSGVAREKLSVVTSCWTSPGCAEHVHDHARWAEGSLIKGTSRS